jgi:hypothetical protein
MMMMLMTIIMTEAMMFEMVTSTVANRCIVVSIIISIYGIDINNIYFILTLYYNISTDPLQLSRVLDRIFHCNSIVQVNGITHHH